MTHEEACFQLRDLAGQFHWKRISYDEWYKEVDRIITAVEQRASGPRPEPADARRAQRLASRTSTPHGSPPRTVGQWQADQTAHAAAQALQ
jgi:hypothetical protein